MIRDIVQALDYSDLAEVSLVLFAVAFALVVYASMKLSRSAAQAFASVPLFDEPLSAAAPQSSTAELHDAAAHLEEGRYV